MRILHERVVLQDGLPVLVVLAVSWVLPRELLYGYLVAVEVLEDQVVEVRYLVVLAELDLDVGLARALRLRALLVRDVAVGLNDVELVIVSATELGIAAQTAHEAGCETATRS